MKYKWDSSGIPFGTLVLSARRQQSTDEVTVTPDAHSSSVPSLPM
jgi:hypothetical protein